MFFRKKMKYYYGLLFTFFFLFILLPYAEAGEIPDIQAKAAIIMDESSGRVLYEQNTHERLPEASLTKIMTALLVIENGNLDQKVKISKHAAETGESSIWLEEGEILSRRELLYSLMLNSANDAAVALAESVAGSEERFVAKMNDRAQELNLKDTHFANPHGLTAEGHYSSAYDLASLARVGMDNNLFSQVVVTRETNVPWIGHPWQRSLFNRNQLLSRYEGARGVKTGYTNQAGPCLVGAAQRGQLKLITVVLNTPSIYDDTEKLLDYGFQHYEAVVLKDASKARQVKVKKGTKDFVEIKPEQDVVVAVLPEEKEHISIKTEIPEEVRAPVKKDVVLGKGKVFLKGKEIAQVNYYTQESMPEKPSFWRTFTNWLRSLFR